MHQLISQTTQYLDSWLSDVEVDGDTCPSAPQLATPLTDPTRPTDLSNILTQSDPPNS